MGDITNIVDEAKYKVQKEVLNLYNMTTLMLDTSGNKIYEYIGVDVFKDYKSILNENIKEIDFQPIYKYKPEYVAYNEYGSASLDYFVLHANKMTSKKQFKLENFLNGKIKIYDKEAINSIKNDINSKSSNNKTISVINSDNYLLYKI